MEWRDVCLDADEVAAFMSGGLAASQRKTIELHVARCEPCRQLLSVVARTDTVSLARSTSRSRPGGLVPVASEPSPHGADPTIGTRVGRYVLHERLGSGAMGVVFAARDPELDRNVAIKLLRSDLIAEASRTSLGRRLLREARAMARLAHPNVVTVYDVGAFGERLFIAMELVEGQTLARWLEDRHRPLREVVELFIAAGRGLAAAHAAGLVHRDFKPENVLLGDDGRVRVTDFGLAHHVALPEASIAGSRAIAERDRATVTGFFAGTPFYMAPEQLACERVDARSDQFSFCVALYAAVTGAHPFPAGSRTDDAQIVRPRRSAMPSWLWRAVRTGLSVARDQRHASMDALLSRLARGARRRRVAGVGLAGLAAVLMVTGGVVLFRDDAGVVGSACQGAERLLAGVWDPARARAVERSFLATGAGDAATRFATASLLLDQYARRWITMRTQACERALSGDESEALSAVRTGCFDARLDELRELTSELIDADAALVGRSGIQIERLGKLDVCADTTALQHMMASDAGARSRTLVALDAAGRLNYFVTDAERQLWQIPTEPDGTAKQRIAVIVPAVGSPVIVADTERRWQLFVRGAERKLRHLWLDAADGSWREEVVTDDVTDDPGVILAGDKLVCFVRRADGGLWRYWQDTRSGRTWTGVRVASAVTGRPGVGFDVAGHLFSFVRKADGSLWYAQHASPAAPPRRSSKLSENVVTGPTVAREPTGHMTYFVRRSDDQLMTGYQDAAGSSVWHRFLITDQVAGDPALVFDHGGREICMSRKRDGSLWHGIQHGPAMGPWHETIVTRDLASDPAIVQGDDNRTIYVVRKTDGLLWQGRQDAPGGTTWHEHALPWSARGMVDLPDRETRSLDRQRDGHAPGAGAPRR